MFKEFTLLIKKTGIGSTQSHISHKEKREDREGALELTGNTSTSRFFMCALWYRRGVGIHGGASEHCGVCFDANRKRVVGFGFGMGFKKTWGRQR